MHRRACLLIAALAGVPLLSAVEFTSPATRTHLIELFTSEGCSSCPPAEAWVTRLRAEAGLWRDFVPIAWHVNYWDHLGWRDRLATPQSTQRQHRYAEAWRSNRVYTPCLVLNGREWRNEHQLPARSSEAAGVLRASLGEGRLRVTYEAGTTGNFEVHAALLTMDAQSKPTRGENRGRDLRHAFVAGLPMTAMLEHGAAELSLPNTARPSNSAVAIWITRRGDLTPVQATGGMISPPKSEGNEGEPPPDAAESRP
jgi:hypothetical protein